MSATENGTDERYSGGWLDVLHQEIENQQPITSGHILRLLRMVEAEHGRVIALRDDLAARDAEIARLRKERSLHVDIQPLTYIDPKDHIARAFPGGFVKLIPTETVRDDGARLYTDTLGNPIIYIKPIEDEPSAS